MQRITQPLFRIDPGWLFLVAGILLIGASVLVPQQARLHGLREQLAVLESLEDYSARRVQAYGQFLERVEAGDPIVMRRLAAAQLRVTDAGFDRLAEAPTSKVPVSSWIDSAVPPALHEPAPMPDTLLGRWTTGRHQFWLGGLGAFSAFVGLMLGTGAPRESRRFGDRGAGTTSARATIAAGGLLGVDGTETASAPAGYGIRGGSTGPAEVMSPREQFAHGAD